MAKGRLGVGALLTIRSAALQQGCYSHSAVSERYERGVLVKLFRRNGLASMGTIRCEVQV